MKSRISCFIKQGKKLIRNIYHVLSVFGAIAILPNVLLFFYRLLLVIAEIVNVLYKFLKFIVDSCFIYPNIIEEHPCEV